MRRDPARSRRPWTARAFDFDHVVFVAMVLRRYARSRHEIPDTPRHPHGAQQRQTGDRSARVSRGAMSSKKSGCKRPISSGQSRTSAHVGRLSFQPMQDLPVGACRGLRARPVCPKPQRIADLLRCLRLAAPILDGRIRTLAAYVNSDNQSRLSVRGDACRTAVLISRSEFHHDLH